MTDPTPPAEAVEIMCRAIRPGLWDEMAERYKEQHRAEVRKEITALLRAGWKLEPPKANRFNIRVDPNLPSDMVVVENDHGVEVGRFVNIGSEK